MWLLRVFVADVLFMRCKSLIRFVFQRSDGVNFTNGTWNRKNEFRKFLFYIYIILLLLLYIGVCSSVLGVLGGFG